jgi:2-acylglycerol O-acyltransferase 2
MSPKSEAPSIQEQQHLSVDGHAREERPSKLPRNLSASTLKKLSKFSVAAATATSSVKFVPAQVPRKRRLQTLAVATWSVMIVITSCTWIFLW